MYKKIILLLGLCTIFVTRLQAEDVNNLKTQEETLSIALTGYDVNETTLKLSWSIKNNSDHDILICDAIDERLLGYPPGFDRYVAVDNQTLVFCWRLDKPILAMYPNPVDFFGRYVRLRANQEWSKSLTFALPLGYSTLIEIFRGDASYATRLAIEIGYYDEDLPAQILQIVDVARRFNCESIKFEYYSEDWKIFRRYFAGILIEDSFNKWADFRESITSGADEIIIPYIGEFGSRGEHVLDEKILRLDISGVHIPMR